MKLGRRLAALVLVGSLTREERHSLAMSLQTVAVELARKGEHQFTKRLTFYAAPPPGAEGATDVR